SRARDVPSSDQGSRALDASRPDAPCSTCPPSDRTDAALGRCRLRLGPHSADVLAERSISRTSRQHRTAQPRTADAKPEAPRASSEARGPMVNPQMVMYEEEFNQI